MNDSYGPWHYDPDRLVLTHVAENGATGYELDPEECTSSAKTLDLIAQVASKTWGSAADVGHLVHALDDLLGLQANLCPCGTDTEISDVRTLIAHHRRPGSSWAAGFRPGIRERPAPGLLSA
jgi:hypothetical protein